MMFVLPPTTPVPCIPATKSNGLDLSKIGVSKVMVQDGFLPAMSAVIEYRACERAAVWAATSASFPLIAGFFVSLNN